MHTNRLLEALEPRRLLAAAFPLVIGSDTYDIATAITVDSQGSTIVAGMFGGTVDFQPGTSRTLLTSNGVSDVFVAKYSARGKLLWVHQFGTAEGRPLRDEFTLDPLRGSMLPLGAVVENASEYVTAVAVDAEDNLYLTGAFRGSVDFDPGPGQRILSSAGEWDIFVLKLSGEGELDYLSQFGGEFSDVANDIAVDAMGNAHVTGYFTRRADFNPTSAVYNVEARGRDDIFVMQLGVSGRLAWLATMGGDEIAYARRESGNALVLDEAGNVYVTGTFAAEADFHPGRAVHSLTSAGETDTFIALLSVNGKLAWVKQIGGRFHDGGLKLARGDGGEIYVGSYFQVTADADPGEGVVTVDEVPERIGRRARHTDLLINKLTGDGEFIWARPIGGAGYETLGGMELDSEGNLYLAGGFRGTVDFAPGPSVSNLTSARGVGTFRDRNERNRRDSYDVYLARFNPSGNLMTARRFGSSGDDFATALALDPRNDELRVAGRFRGTVDFNPSPAFVRHIRAGGQVDAFVSALDRELTLLGERGEPAALIEDL